MMTDTLQAPVEEQTFDWEDVPTGAKFFFRDNKTPYFKLTDTHYSYKYRHNESFPYSGFVNDIVWHSQMRRTA